jgi:hypothetical protein
MNARRHILLIHFPDCQCRTPNVCLSNTDTSKNILSFFIFLHFFWPKLRLKPFPRKTKVSPVSKHLRRVNRMAIQNVLTGTASPKEWLDESHSHYCNCPFLTNSFITPIFIIKPTITCFHFEMKCHRIRITDYTFRKPVSMVKFKTCLENVSILRALVK